MPNDLPPATDLSEIRASGVLPKAGSSVRRLAPFALAIGALGIAAALRYRGRYRFENKIVVITGASRGLGLIIARELAAQGALLGLLAADALELARARRTITSESLVQLLPADVTDAAQAEQAFSTMVRRFGRIDVVINDAGSNVTRAALPHLARHGNGRIVNICSGDAARVMAAAARAKGIRVTTVLPEAPAKASAGERAARLILDAAARGRTHAKVPMPSSVRAAATHPEAAHDDRPSWPPRRAQMP